jgi:putative hemolysin
VPTSGVSSVGGKPLVLSIGKFMTAKSIASYAKLKVLSTSKISLKVVASSANYCKVSGATLKGLKTGLCKVTVKVTPKKGKATSKTVNLKVALNTPAATSPNLTTSQPASAKSIAAYANLPVNSTSKVTMKVVASSAKYCKVSGATLKGLKAGSCKVTVTVATKAGNSTSKTVNLRVAQ